MSYPAPFGVESKIAVIPGAGSGLGVEFAEILAEAGADVVYADIDLSAARATARRVDGPGRRSLAIPCDVASESEVQDALATAKQEFGRVDILFNNAGIADPTPSPLHLCSTEDWMKVLSIKVHEVFSCAREALQMMVEQGSRKIINIASTWGMTGASSSMAK